MKDLIAKAQEDCTTFALLMAFVFLLGAVLGFAVAPIKRGLNLSIGSNNSVIGCVDDEDDEVKN